MQLIEIFSGLEDKHDSKVVELPSLHSLRSTRKGGQLIYGNHINTMRSHNLSWPIEGERLWSNCAIMLPPHNSGHRYLFHFQFNCKLVNDLFNPQGKIVECIWSYTNYGHEANDLMTTVCVCLIFFTSFYIYTLADFMKLATKKIYTSQWERCSEGRGPC